MHIILPSPNQTSIGKKPECLVGETAVEYCNIFTGLDALQGRILGHSIWHVSALEFRSVLEMLQLSSQSGFIMMMLK